MSPDPASAEARRLDAVERVIMRSRRLEGELKLARVEILQLRAQLARQKDKVRELRSELRSELPSE